MHPRMLPFSQVIEQERRRWMPFRRALSKEDQEAFDRLFTYAKQQHQAAVQLGRSWRFEDEVTQSAAIAMLATRPAESRLGCRCLAY
jgi:hypothetical protein